MATSKSNQLIKALSGGVGNPENMYLRSGWQWEWVSWNNRFNDWCPINVEEKYQMDRDIIGIINKLNENR